MKLWIFSDIHIEQSFWDLPDPKPDYDVMIAAGDIHFATDGVRWLSERADGKPVIYVPGNHEWYSYKRRFAIEQELPEARKIAETVGVHFLWDEEVIIGDVRFLVTPLWTDFALHGDAIKAMAYAKVRMNDHHLIYPRSDMLPLQPDEARDWHMQSRRWLEKKLAEVTALKTVVVTHHLPHPRSIAKQYAADPLTPAFCSDMSDLVEGASVALWVHGHTHTSCDYHAGKTRIVCNPKGYGPTTQFGAAENERFNPRFVAEV